MYYSNIKYCDIANGPGVRTSLFVSGCTHRCPNCFNSVAWDFHYGESYTDAIEEKLMESLAPGYVAGLSLLGGEPMEPENQRTVLGLCQRVRRELPGKTIWCYSGYTLEELTGECRARCTTDEALQILQLLDVLVDGEFVMDKYDISLRFRGSSNQRLIDVPASLESGHVVLWQDDPLFETHRMM